MKIGNLFHKGLMFCGGWLFLVPLSFVFPKRQKRIAFIGRDDGLFLDNVKYSFLHAKQYNAEGYDAYFLTENKKVYDELSRHDLPCMFHPSLKSFIMMLTTSIMVIDSPSWTKTYKYFLLFNCKSIQIWHGVPLKKIQLECRVMAFRKVSWFADRVKTLYYEMAGHFPTYDIVISTSSYFTRHAFKNAFHTKRIFEGGYPRNDILKKGESNSESVPHLELLWTDSETITSVKNAKQAGIQIVLYAPTFRETGGDLFETQANFFDQWDVYGKKNRIVFVIKSHPLPKSLYNRKAYSNILFYQNNKDVYPLMPLTDLLITDYSSIYFDYLFLDKPIIFFPYDFEKYITSDKELRFDYDSFTPGPICRSQEELEAELFDILVDGNDQYTGHREEIKNLAFTPDSKNGCEDVWNLIVQLCSKNE